MHLITRFTDVLEFTVVTSNATIVKASPFSNPTLFKALRGGGPAFGVVTEVALRTHTPPEGFVGIFGTFEIKEGVEKSVADEAWTSLIRQWVALQPKLSDAGPFAGYTYVVRSSALPLRHFTITDIWFHCTASSSGRSLRLHPPLPRSQAREISV